MEVIVWLWIPNMYWENISIMEMGKLVPLLFRYFKIEWASREAEWLVETWWFAKQHVLKCRMRSRDVPANFKVLEILAMSSLAKLLSKSLQYSIHYDGN